jgi:hypothetical protein
MPKHQFVSPDGQSVGYDRSICQPLDDADEWAARATSDIVQVNDGSLLARWTIANLPQPMSRRQHAGNGNGR